VERGTDARRARAEQERRRTIDREQSERRRNAERERNAERSRAAEGGRSTREQPATDRARDGQALERREELRLARQRLAPAERQRLRAAFDFRRARASNVKFDRRVGHRVPRHVRLFPIPIAVVSFFPYYRDYSYFAVEDEICIVDPRTYEIVDVIDQDYYRGVPRQETAALSLTSAQIALVRDSIPRDFPEADVQLRLALGAEIPRRVELYEFPALVLDRIPKLRDFRFIVADDQIVIVGPADRSIALVVDRV
jgi:hypothetical protein